MAETRKILGQSNPAATTLTDVYTVPAATQAVISSFVVCNRSLTPTSFRISVAIAGAANNNKQYIYYDLPLPANDTFIGTIGGTLNAADVVRIYVNDATVSFNIFGVEIT